MRNCCVGALVALLLAFSTLAQQSETKTKPREGKQNGASQQPDVKNLLESKIRAEWEAFKKKDRKAYSNLLADDFVAVETDNQGTRNRIHAVNEIEGGNVHDYILTGINVMPLGSDSAFVTYESTIEFPPKAAVRFSRVYISELWLKRDGQWKERHYQETHVR